MKIILGRYMDGGAWPDAVTHFGSGQNAVDGVKVCGPMGFISLLHEKLGLPNPAEHGSKRIATWENLLKQHVPSEEQNGEPFYSASFRADSWNTAKRLLQLRDELKEAGALEDSGTKQERALALESKAARCQDAVPRLAEMFRLEAEHLRGNPVPGTADSFRLVLDELCFQEGNSALSGLLHVELATPEGDWQETWKGLFRLLRACGVTVTAHSSASAFPEKILKKKDLASCPAFSSGEHIDLFAANLPEAAEALAAVFHSRLKDGHPGQLVLLRTENSVELDGALARYSLPGSECRNRSTARPFVQLLPLYLRLQLLPFDPETLRQFLLLPVNPVEASLRRKLLSALKYEEFAPWGKDYKAWPKSWQKAFRGDDDKPLCEAQCKEQIRWFCPLERVEPNNDNAESIAISPALIAQHAATLGKWAKEVAQPPQPKTEELCKRLAEATNSLSGKLFPLAFEKLLDSVLGEGENSTEKRRPVPWKLVSEPGQIWKELGEEDTVIWWDFTDSGQALRDSSAWSDKEKEWLKANEHSLFDFETERQALDHAMAAPFLFARRVITVTPRFHGAEESRPHPLRALLPEDGTASIEASDILNGTARHDFFHIEDRVALTPAPAPIPWQEEKGHALELPKKISPSTLESALACPAAWYFRNILGLDGERNKLAGDPITCGNLAHEIMERLLKERRDTPVERTEKELLEHISAMIDELAQDKAARMALPEYKVLRKSMAARLAHSFREFCKRMEEHGLDFLDSEQTYKGMLGGAECTGRYDLVLTRQGSNKPAVVADMKWSRRKIYKEQTMEGRAVQLAAYHFLLDKGRKVTGWKDGEPVLAPHNSVQLENAWFFLLPEASVHASPIPLAEQWKNIEDNWHNMCGSLAEGRLPLAEAGELPTVAAHKTDDSPCTYCSYKRLCGRPQDANDLEEDSTEEQE